MTKNRAAEQTLRKLQQRINAHDALGVCALYRSPSRRCVAIWQHRIDQFHTPVRFSMKRLILGCAGDARLVFAERSRRSLLMRTLSLVNDSRGYRLIIDVPMGHRRSSLVVPAAGTCAEPGDGPGGIGADNLDPASAP
jgi:hypothetical protein